MATSQKTTKYLYSTRREGWALHLASIDDVAGYGIWDSPLSLADPSDSYIFRLCRVVRAWNGSLYHWDGNIYDDPNMAGSRVWEWRSHSSNQSWLLASYASAGTIADDHLLHLE